jgi:uncharacterized protein DUF5678
LSRSEPTPPHSALAAQTDVLESKSENKQKGSLMTEIVLGEPLSSQIREAAEAQGIAVENLIEAALRQYSFQAQRTKLDTEAHWWRGVSPERWAPYAGEYVAVHYQEVVDHDRDEETLRRRVRARCGKLVVWIAPAEGRREWRMVSTRQARS